MAGNRLLMLRLCGGLAVGLLACAAGRAQEAGALKTAQTAKPLKYPLRLHVLASDEFHKTVRMQPQYDSATAPDVSTGVAASGGGGGGTSSYTSFGGDDDFSGSGRADLVSPPSRTQGLSFRYEGCSRVRVPAGFQGLQARWKKPGRKLEVLFPSYGVPDGDRPLKLEKCTLTVTLHEYVYLRARTGKLVQVSQEDFWKKPSLRMFLSGGAVTLQERPAQTGLRPQSAAPPPPAEDAP